MANNKNFIAKNGVSTGDGYAMPDVRPSLLLDFANSKTLDPRITFTRGSTATYWDGHTTTKAEENLMTYSQSISNKTQEDCTAVDNSATAPDGTTTATKITLNAATAQFYDGYLNPRTTNSGEDYTHSVYAKAGTGVSAVYLYTTTGGDGGSIAKFNISTGTYIGNASGNGYNAFDSYSITGVGNGWYRISATKTEATGASRAFTLGISNTTADVVTTFDAAGTEFCYLWGAQLEERSSATAYTATTSSPIVKYQPTLQTASSGEARFDHDPVTGESKGLLIEESRTNYLPQSQDLTSAEWSKSGVTIDDNFAVAPDGTLTACNVRENTNTGSHDIRDNQTLSASTTYTYSFYAKANGRTRLVYYCALSTGSAGGSFNLETGNATAGYMEDVGNGWYRCWATITTASSGGAFNFIIILNDAAQNSSYTGDGYSGVLIWGAQLETGAFPTSYIPTSGSTVTRSVDSAYMDVTEGTFGDELTVYAEVDDAPKGYFPRIVALRDTTANAGPFDFYSSNGNAIGNDSIVARIYAFGAVYANPSLSYLSRKLAAAYDVTGISAMSDANTTVQTDSSIVFPQFDRIWVGAYSTTQGLPNVGIKKIALYPKKLSDATITAMTED